MKARNRDLLLAVAVVAFAANWAMVRFIPKGTFVEKGEERSGLILEEIRTNEANSALQTRRNQLLENVIESKREQYQDDILDLKNLAEAETGLIQAKGGSS